MKDESDKKIEIGQIWKWTYPQVYTNIPAFLNDYMIILSTTLDDRAWNCGSFWWSGSEKHVWGGARRGTYTLREINDCLEYVCDLKELLKEVK